MSAKLFSETLHWQLSFHRSLRTNYIALSGPTTLSIMYPPHGNISYSPSFRMFTWNNWTWSLHLYTGILVASKLASVKMGSVGYFHG